MSSEFPVLLAWAFLGSLVLGLLNTSRWTAILLSVIAVWFARLEQSDINLVTAGTVEGYAWFAFLSAAVGIPAMAASLVGSDLGAALLNLFMSRFAPAEAEIDETEDAEAAPE